MECLTLINPNEISDFPVPEKSDELVNPVSLKAVIALPDKKICFNSGKDKIKIQIANIIFCKAQRKKTEIVCVNQKTLFLELPLRDVEEALKPFRFVRSHKEYLVNIDYVTSITGRKSKKLLMLENHTIPCSDYFFIEVKELLESGVLIVDASSN
ncbi:MAG: hypothetical protein A2275_02265 [Bacteroidetes bacterium RIFOXYA12_FULL_35_11]|nr:MAG: hypothetical protein A2X01_12515 [Bacteroidetes bacterium GWF2_35_48]OFY72422.1 MAG: hypothetical protein A2275_02265 [Bacteroidetes bacterium RIFOXYA12_FULL_35_11]HBX53757.1 hypothetical protein [Bacteroidales bacterium]